MPGRTCLLAGTAPVLLAVLVDGVAGLLRREVGLDLIALLPVGGAVALGEHVAAGVVGLMLSGGRGRWRATPARAPGGR